MRNVSFENDSPNSNGGQQNRRGESPTNFRSKAQLQHEPTVGSSLDVGGRITVKDKKISMMTVRNIMRMGRGRLTSQSRESSTDNEER